ncbi:MAG: 2-oxoacid:ferredoxin oxidoreductase subunit beta [Candidatus Brocadiia bacterium]
MTDNVDVISGHPLDKLIRQERMPHIWCSGCGLGTIFGNMLRGIVKSGVPLDKVAVVSGIGCTGRVSGYVKFDGFHTTHGRAIPFATGLKLARPELNVIVISGEGDLTAIGGNHFIHAARRNVNITVICANNSNYGMTGGQCSPTTPAKSITTTTPYGNFESSFSLPHLAAASGAVFVSRWTTYHVMKLQSAISRAVLKNGFSFIEVMSPCPTYYGRSNKLGAGLEMMKFYKNNTVIKQEVQLKDIGIGRGEKIVIGDFVDIERPTFNDLLRERDQKLCQAAAGKEEKKKLEHE